MKQANDLYLPLIRKWYDMTTAGIKTEDYRLITPHWAKRVLLYQGEELKKSLDELSIEELCDDLNKAINCIGPLEEEVWFVLDDWYLTFKQFDHNIMTLGYPKKGDPERTAIFKHAGIEIRTGNPDWGAEPNKLYFVIKHGERVEQGGKV